MYRLEDIKLVFQGSCAHFYSEGENVFVDSMLGERILFCKTTEKNAKLIVDAMNGIVNMKE